MKLTCTQENLTKSLSIIGRSIGKDSTLPILANVLLETENKRLKLSTTNLELSSSSLIGAKIEKEGKTTVPAQLLFNYINNLPTGNIELEVKNNILSISTSDAQTEMKIINPDDFPLIPKTEAKPFCGVAGSELKQALDQVVFAAAPDESRPEITGVYLKLEKSQIKIAATDSYRLAEKIIKPVETTKGKLAMIIPVSAMQEINRVISEDVEYIEFTSSDNQIKFSFNDTEITSRLIEGQYPDYTRIIPKKFETKVVLETPEFISALRAASFFSKRDAAEVIIKTDNKRRRIEVVAESGDLGKNVSHVGGDVQGDDREISFNPQYLLDSLTNIDTSQVSLMITADERVGALQPVNGEEDYIYIAMPIVKK